MRLPRFRRRETRVWRVDPMLLDRLLRHYVRG